MTPPKTPLFSFQRLFFVISALAMGSLSCASQESLGAGALSLVSEGVLNDPGNKSLRFDILDFGFGEFCAEMLRRGAPIKTTDNGPVTGRFFASGCRTQVLRAPSRQGLLVTYEGQGYGWTPLTQRVGFRAQGTLEYAVDFQRFDNRLYVYFRPRGVDSTRFEPTLLESPLAQVGIALSGVNPQSVGQELISQQLQRGFTVLRHSEKGETEFSAGILAPGTRPFRPYRVEHTQWRTALNQRTSVQLGQQDFVGGIHVEGHPRLLRLHATLAGPAAVDVFIVPEEHARQLLEQYIHRPGPVSLARPPTLERTILRAQPLLANTTIPPGNYFLVLDHSRAAGRASPPGTEPPATVDYLVQLSAAR